MMTFYIFGALMLIAFILFGILATKGKPQ